MFILESKFLVEAVSIIHGFVGSHRSQLMQTDFLFAVALMKTSRNEVTNAQVYHINCCMFLSHDRFCLFGAHTIF